MGRSVLFLHGEANTSAWRRFHETLAGDFEVHAPVHPGFGESPLPDWLRDTSDLAFHYVDVIRDLGLHKPIVVGESLGGWIALDLAIHRPDLLGGLVLIGALGLRPTEPMPDLFIKFAPDALGYLANTIDTDVVDPMTGDPVAATALWVEQAAQARLMWERPYDPRIERRAHHVTCPSLVIWGTGDRLLPPEHGRRLAEVLGTEPHMIDGAGHLATLDAPDAVAAAIRTFAAALEPPAESRETEGLL